MLDSHDTPRALWHMGDDLSALKLCTLLQMTMPGAPNIYYGSEIGMTGGPDPGCRGAFPWDQESTWDSELLDYFRCAISLRHQYSALRTGSFRSLYGQNGVYAFLREQNGRPMIAAFNANKKPVAVDLPHGLADGAQRRRSFRAVWGKSAAGGSESGGRDYITSHDKLSGVRIPAREGILLLGVS